MLEVTRRDRLSWQGHMLRKDEIEGVGVQKERPRLKWSQVVEKNMQE